MSVEIKFENIKAVLPLFVDRDKNGILSFGDSLSTGVLEDSSPDAEPVYWSVGNSHLADWQSADTFLESISGRKLQFIVAESGIPSYFAYSSPLSTNTEPALAGIVDLKSNTAANSLSVFNDPDYAELIRKHQDASARCEMVRGLKRKECLEKASTRAEALFKSAQDYDVHITALEDSRKAANTLFISGALTEAASQTYLTNFSQAELAAKEFYLSKLDIDFRPDFQ